jgi:hypothetical protein
MGHKVDAGRDIVAIFAVSFKEKRHEGTSVSLVAAWEQPSQDGSHSSTDFRLRNMVLLKLQVVQLQDQGVLTPSCPTRISVLILPYISPSFPLSLMCSFSPSPPITRVSGSLQVSVCPEGVCVSPSVTHLAEKQFSGCLNFKLQRSWKACLLLICHLGSSSTVSFHIKDLRIHRFGYPWGIRDQSSMVSLGWLCMLV